MRLIRQLLEDFPYQERQMQNAPATSRAVSSRKDNERMAPDAAKIGRGLYSAVYARRNKPHDVRKVSGQWGIDGTFYYLKAIRDSGDAANPFYPKIRNLRAYIDKASGEYTSYTAEMERLRPMYELGREEIVPMSERLFNPGWMTDVVGRPDYEEPSVGNVALMISYLCDKDIMTDDEAMDAIRDPNLKRAVKLIRTLQDNAAADIGENNLMVRRTPVGPQIVITDPLA